jgi:hypothetical protein
MVLFVIDSTSSFSDSLTISSIFVAGASGCFSSSFGVSSTGGTTSSCFAFFQN